MSDVLVPARAPEPSTPADSVCPTCGNGDEGNWYPVSGVCVPCRTNETRARVALEMQAGSVCGVAASLASMCVDRSRTSLHETGR